MTRCIITYAEGAHEELLEIALPRYRDFAQRHGYDLIIGKKKTALPPAWNKVFLLREALIEYAEVVWFDCDLVIVDPIEDFPAMPPGKVHSLVRHCENGGEVPNSGVWRTRRQQHESDLNIIYLFSSMKELTVFTNHGWWEQAALMTLMGYTVPPEGSEFSKTRCRNVVKTNWYNTCQFMRLSWNSHPNYRACKPKIVHCSYPDMQQRIEVMRELVRNPQFNYPRYDDLCSACKKARRKEG